ncbi:MFS transporter [Companilactobacillus keshanensis]|uniref:MFS transporter n=1 Tax=Companilactobacillus keshanensis TaxID=2486003 RepID=A0ABW4BVU6_9LACO|nr:MFS transporter [Companilactobacillus keshanensis]
MNKKILLASIFISTFMTSVETTVVTTALPTIIGDLHGLSMQSWVFAIYLLTTAITTPIYGKLSDNIGRRPVFLIGLIIFTVGSFLCGFATNMYLLIVYRAIQGIGAGAIRPITFTIIADMFSFQERSKIMALNNTAWGVSALAGPLLGGFIVDKLNWHWVFFINVPLGIIVFLLILFRFEESFDKKYKLDIDYSGIGLLTIVLMSLLLSLQSLGNVNSNYLLVSGGFIVFFIAIFFLIKVEKKSIFPLIPLDMFKSRTFTIQILTALFMSGIQIGFQIYFPMWMQSIYQRPSSIAGLSITPSPIMWLVASFFTGILIRKFAPKFITISIVIVQMLFYLILVFNSTQMSIIWFYIIAGITGSGLGIIITMNTVIAQELVDEENVGTASSMVTLGITLGQTIMTGIFGLIFNISINHNSKLFPQVSLTHLNNSISSTTHGRMNDISAINQILLSSFHNIYAAVLLIFVILIVLNLWDKRNTPISK